MLVESLRAILAKLPDGTEITYQLDEEEASYGDCTGSLAEKEVNITIDCCTGWYHATITLCDV